jgi:hypothetical protein
MYIEKSKTIVADGTQADFLRDSARHMLNIYRQCAVEANAPKAMRDAWAEIKGCLGATSDDLTEAQRQKWEQSYLSFLAEGIPPSPALADVYKYYKETAAKEQWPVIPISDPMRAVIRGMSALPASADPRQQSGPEPKKEERSKHSRGSSSVAVDLVLTVLCAGYLGYQHDPYIAVAACSILWSGYFLWMNRDLVTKARVQSFGVGSTATLYTRMATLLIFASIVLCFLAIGSAAYFSMAYLHG